MQSELTDTQRDIQKAVSEFAEKEFDLDLALELEKEERFPRSIFKKACELGFIGIDYPEQYGGQSFGFFENILVTEEFCTKDSGIGIALSLADIASSIILKHGDENQKKRFLIPFTQGKVISTIGVINQFHRKNLNTILLKEEVYPEGYIIIGEKVLIINGSIADNIVIFGETSNNTNPIALIIHKDQEGVNVLGKKKMMGIRMSSIIEISLKQVRVLKDYVIQDDDGRTDPLTTYLHIFRIKTSAQGLGIAQKAFDLALKHAREREQFGRKIYQFQGINS